MKEYVCNYKIKQTKNLNIFSKPKKNKKKQKQTKNHKNKKMSLSPLPYNLIFFIPTEMQNKEILIFRI